MIEFRMDGNSGKFLDMCSWLSDTAGPRGVNWWYSFPSNSTAAFYFYHSEDAILFAIKWSEYILCMA